MKIPSNIRVSPSRSSFPWAKATQPGITCVVGDDCANSAVQATGATGVGGHDCSNGAVQATGDKVADAVARHGWIAAVARVGWAAKGVVYALMGTTAFTIGRGKTTADDASPEGALGQVGGAGGQRWLLLALAVGLALYGTWRILSALLVRGTELADWADRIGYVFSAVFYAFLAYTAAMAARAGVQPEDSNSMERASSLLATDWGRLGLATIGALILGIGVYFVIKKGFMRSFWDDLSRSGLKPSEALAIDVTGTFGWISRGVATAAVGYYFAVAAWRGDSSEVRGFDGSLRAVASHDRGRAIVWLCGAGLVAYGIFCAVSARHQKLEV